MKIYVIRKKKGRKYESKACASAAAGVRLEYEPSGKPVALTEEGEAPLFVSVSDTKNWWAMLEADRPCGFDLEENGRNLSAATAKKLHALEQQYLSGLEPLSSEWRAEFLNIWVRKEAYMKYCGEGLGMGLGKFSVLDERLEYADTVCAKNRPAACVASAVVLPGLTAAAACEGPFEAPEVIECDYAGESERDVMDEAAELLTARSLTKAELAKKLKSKGFETTEIEEAAGRLEELGYVDDASYAARYATDAARKGKGRLRIARELAQKGLDTGDAKDAIEALAGEEDVLPERERAMAEAQKMLRGEKPDEKTLARIARRLSAYGYEPSVIWDVVGKLRNS
ncbi:MAG: RecX family transcriptional regulator [Firmicutes bacterium]|nr:RecX family transcriptional regulator [Bacillota bacterium]